MGASFSDSMAAMQVMSAQAFHETALEMRRQLGSLEWHLGVCLLAGVRGSRFQELGYSSFNDYVERGLQLEGKKAATLLSCARALEHLPLLSEAFRRGQICWAKIRAIHTLATPECEAEWLEFVQSHRSDQVASKVAMCPASWKRHKALKASLDGKPICTPQALTEALSAEGSAGEPETQGGSAEGVSLDADSAAATASAHEQKEIGKRSLALTLPGGHTPKIRLSFDLEADQFALYEQAEKRLKARAGKRLRRAEVLTMMAEAVLNEGTSRSRAKYQVAIYKDEVSGEAWYETSHGPRPVKPEIVEQALRSRQPFEVQRPEVGVPCAPSYECSTGSNRHDAIAKADSKVKSLPKPYSETGAALARVTERRTVPAPVLRALYARAGGRCEKCGASLDLSEAHHEMPVSEGGGNTLSELKALCRSCHRSRHEQDFATRPAWKAARQKAVEARTLTRPEPQECPRDG